MNFFEFFWIMGILLIYDVVIYYCNDLDFLKDILFKKCLEVKSI